MRKKLLFGLLISISQFGILQAQEIWPGDVNNNGVVNPVDLLYWGAAFGSEGPERDEQGVLWQAYDPPVAWSQDFPGGLNYAYADCNGDGVVNEDDYDDAIEDNFGLTHPPLFPDGYSNADEGEVAPRFLLEPDATVVQEGAMVNITLRLDDTDMPLGEFYGMALSLGYTTGLLAGDDGPDFELAEMNWIEADGSYVEDVYDETGPLGTAGLGITRTNQTPIAAQQTEIGTFSIVIEDIIVGLEVDTFELWIDSIFLISPDLITVPVITDTARIIIAKDISMVSTQTANLPRVAIFPNPTAGDVFIRTDLSVEQIKLTDAVGRAVPVLMRAVEPGLYLVDCSQLPPGLYWLTAQHPRGRIVEKIIISN